MIIPIIKKVIKIRIIVIIVTVILKIVNIAITVKTMMIMFQ